jgi:uncharacterized membrane protein YgcG
MMAYCCSLPKMIAHCALKLATVWKVRYRCCCEAHYCQTITPHFKRGNYYAGISTGIEQLLAVIEGESLPPPRERSAISGSFQNLEPFLFIGFMLVIVVGGVLRKLLGRLPAAMLLALLQLCSLGS